ncbi:hypothetical protein CASFOL_020788 [Castilleja foliolosa]|uniref:Uncharacterized protein n=1 Tax=Castilleja foliolosa TaxID=1961234 RepID=A0ABD3D3W5_9LAMI
MTFLVKKILQLSTNQKTASLHLNYHQTANLRPMAFHSDSRREIGRVLFTHGGLAKVHIKDVGVFRCSKVPKGLACGAKVEPTSVDSIGGTTVVSDVLKKDEEFFSVRPKIAHLDQIILLFQPDHVIDKGYSLTRFLVQAHSKLVTDVLIALTAEEHENDCLKANKEIREERDGISLECLVGIIRESMMIFRDFVFSDKKATNVVVNGIHGTKIDLQESQNSELLVDIVSNLQKKDRKIRENVKSRNCIVKKLKKYQSSRSGDDDIELLTSQTDLRLISRVLSMSRLTMDQLVWCQDKLNNISFVSRKVYVEPSFLLFPC